MPAVAAEKTSGMTIINESIVYSLDGIWRRVMTTTILRRDPIVVL